MVTSVEVSRDDANAALELNRAWALAGRHSMNCLTVTTPTISPAGKVAVAWPDFPLHRRCADDEVTYRRNTEAYGAVISCPMCWQGLRRSTSRPR